MKNVSLDNRQLYAINALAMLFFIFASIYFADQKELWLDETHSALLSGMSFDELVLFVIGDVHPPAYFVMLWIWVSQFGDAPFTLRMFSLVVHVFACLVFTSLLGYALKNKVAKLTCSLLFILSPALFWYSVEVRMYSLLVFFSVVSIYLFIGIKKKNNSILYSALTGLSLSLLFYTHYAAVFFLIGLFAYFSYMVLNDKDTYLKPFIVTGLVILALTAPWFSTLLDQRETKMQTMIEHSQAQSNMSTLEYNENSDGGVKISKPIDKLLMNAALNMASLSGVYPADNKVLLWILVLPFLVLAVFIFDGLKNRDDLIVFCVVVCAICLVGLVLVLGLIQRRYMLLLSPLIILMIGRTLENMHSFSKVLMLVVSMCLILINAAGVTRIINRQYDKPTVELVDTIKKESAKNSELVVVSSMHGQIPIEYYAKQLKANIQVTGVPVSIHQWWKQQKFKGWGSPVIYKKDIEDLLLRNEQIIRYNEFYLVLFENRHYDPDNYLLKYLHAGSFQVNEIAGFKDMDDREVYKLYKIIKLNGSK